MLSYITKSIVNFVLTIVGTLLGLRFILKLFAANPNNGFVEWIYRTSGEIVSPFRTVFTPQEFEGSIIEFSTLFALIIYGLLGMLAFALIDMLVTPAENKKHRK